jgi:Variant SH3 domain
MKSVSYGLSTEGYLNVNYSEMPSNLKGQSVATYRDGRTNGDSCDHPSGRFPEDGYYSWHRHTDGLWHVKYSGGQGDREWMEQCDRNYLARLEAEKVAPPKQAREVQPREAQEKPRCEQQLKEEAAEQADWMPTMKSASYGLSSPRLNPRLSHPQYYLWCLEAIIAYRSHRTNGAAGDHPSHAFPKDGAYRRQKHTDDLFHVKYIEGPGDRKWMEQCDRNYLTRLEAEKVAARKQAREVQSREAQEKPQREQQLKEAAEEQLKPASSSPTVQASVGENISAGNQEQATNADTNNLLQILLAGSSNTGTGDYPADSPSLRPPPPTPATTFLAEMLYPHQAASAEELTLSAGAKVRVVDQITPDWWWCEHDSQAGLVPSQYLRTLSSAQVPSAHPASYTSYTTPTSGEALGTVGIFPAATPSSAENNHSTESGSYRMTSRQ